MWEGVRDLASAMGSLADAGLAVRRSLRAVLIGIAAFTALAAALVATRTPSYVATVSLLVRPPPDPSDQPQRALLLEGFTSDSAEMQNQIAILQSEGLLRDVYDTLEEHGTDERSFESFAAGVSARRVGLSNVIELTDRNNNPDRAARYANAIAAGFLLSRIDAAADAASLRHSDAKVSAIRNHAAAAATATREGVSPMAVLGGADALVLTAARPPEAPIAPRRGPALIFGALVGAFLPLVFALFRNTADAMIRADRHVVEGFGAPCLARIGRQDGAGTLVAALVPVAHRMKRPAFRQGKTIAVLAPFGPAGAADQVAAALRSLLAGLDRTADVRIAGAGPDVRPDDLVLLIAPEGRARLSAARPVSRAVRRDSAAVLGVVLVGDRARPDRRRPGWHAGLMRPAPPGPA